MARRKRSGISGGLLGVAVVVYLGTLSLVFIVVADVVIVATSIGYAIKHRRDRKERDQREKERRHG